MSLIIYEGEQRTPAWYALRLGIPTASKFDCVMAKGRIAGMEATTRRNYRIQCALELITQQVPEEGYINFAMKQGIEREPVAAMLYEIQTGNELQHVCFIKDEELNAGCSPDGLVGEPGMIETKCGIEATHLEYLELPENKPPADYKWQVYGEMLIARREWVDFVSFNPSFPASLRLHVHRVYRNEAMINELTAGIRQFNAEVEWTVAQIQELARKRAA